MAMTKREQAEMQGLRQELRLAKALRFTAAVAPDVPIPERYGVLAKGFLFHTHGDGFRAVPACSDSCSHSFGSDDKPNSQQARRLYSTRLLALRACRNEAEQHCAKLLAEINEAIEKEEGK
jgi:hypothetical protein